MVQGTAADIMLSAVTLSLASQVSDVLIQLSAMSVARVRMATLEMARTAWISMRYADNFMGSVS